MSALSRRGRLRDRFRASCHSVDLIDKHNARCVLLRVLKQVAHTGRTTPTNISTKSEPEMLKNGTPASPATAFASSVFPVPGGPSRSTPFGILAPTWIYFFGAFRKSTISSNSSFSSFSPATSANVTLISFCVVIRARLLPKLIAFAFAPPP